MRILIQLYKPKNITSNTTNKPNQYKYQINKSIENNKSNNKYKKNTINKRVYTNKGVGNTKTSY